MKFRFPALYWDRKLHILKAEDDYLLLAKQNKIIKRYKLSLSLYLEILQG